MQTWYYVSYVNIAYAKFTYAKISFLNIKFTYVNNMHKGKTTPKQINSFQKTFKAPKQKDHNFGRQ